MIKKELYNVREDGVKLFRTYSDEEKKLVRNDGISYDEAIDVEDSGYSYDESEHYIDDREVIET